jgi:hypothetical protein
MSKLKVVAAVFGLLLGLSGIAQAALYEYTLTGTVTSAVNAGAATGNPISIIIDADDNTTKPSSFAVYLNNSVTPYVNIGSVDLTSYTTTFSRNGSSSLTFTYASLSEFINVIFPTGNPYGTFVINLQPTYSQVSAQINSLSVDNLSGSAVPIPPSVLLLAGGLGGLGFIRRRSAKS